MEGVGTVIALCAFKPGEVFNVGAGQSLPGGGKVLLDPQQVNGRASSGGTECLPGDLAGEGMVLQVEKSGGASTMRPTFRTRPELPCSLEPAALRSSEP